MINFLLNYKAKKILKALQKNKKTISCAESCTGGLLASFFTKYSGSSKIFDCGLVTYSNDAKEKLLGVKKKNLEKYGAVSSEIAMEMANNLFKMRQSDIAVSVTGIAGPTSDDSQKPVGLVYVAFAGKGFESFVLKNNFTGNRKKIQQKTILIVLKNLEKLCSI